MQQISLQELEDWIENGIEFQLVDVREDEEREQYNIGGIHIPLGSISTNLNRLNHNIPLVFYCRKGIRSQIAIQRILTFDKFSANSLFNLRGGIGDNHK
jgi:adenylyltransferase/sulfurtransferase